MSYRSLKRVLGETHLELKCLFLFGGCALVLILGSFWFYGARTETLVYKQNRNKGRLLVNTILTQIHWQNLETSTGRELKDQFAEDLTREQYQWTMLRPAADEGPHRPADEFEHQVLQEFLTAPPAEGEESDFDERRDAATMEYHYYQPIRAAEGCVSCHNITAQRNRNPLTNQPWKEGDLLAVAKVSMSDRPVQSDLNWNTALLWATAIITAFLLVAASYIIIRYVIAKPLKHLQGVSEAISKGNLEERAEINTGDEFEDLASAFNRMVRHLIAAQEEARQVNADLDAKVDELAQRNMQLYEMNRLKSDFLATVSHELRTPLNSIIGFSDVLQSIDALDAKQRRYVDNIQKSGRVLLEMINDILDLAKLESGKTDVRLSEFRLEQVVHAQCDMARPLTEKKNIDLEVKTTPHLAELHQDPAKVQQILNNLLSNAIKFTPEGGRITVSTRDDEDGFFSLIVADTGVGIAEEDQTRIFEKFRQGTTVAPGGDAMTREYSGTGLGLSIVKELCKLLGGEVSVYSALGKGSTFTVKLPIDLPAGREAEPLLPQPVLDSKFLRRGDSRRAVALAATE